MEYYQISNGENIYLEYAFGAEDITDMNGLYLDNKIFINKNNKKKIIDRNRYNNDLIQSIQYNYSNFNKSLNKINKSQDLNLDENYANAIQKKNERNNFMYINGNYRRELNKVFMKYNPITHLNNLKILLQLSPSIREDVKKTKDEVDDDIKNLFDKHKYKKNLNKLLSKNIRSRSVEVDQEKKIYNSIDNSRRKSLLRINEINNNDNKDENTSHDNSNTFINLPKLTKEKGLNNSKEKSVGLNLIEKLKRKEMQKLYTIRNQKLDEAKKLINITKEIDNLIEKKNISEKMDKYIYDYKLQNYLKHFRENEDDKRNIIKDKDYYKQQKSKINYMLGELYINKLQRKVKEKEKFYGDKIRRDKNDYFIKIENELKKGLNEFDNNIILNEINLNQDESNELSNENNEISHEV